MGAIQMSPQDKNGDFIKNGSNDFYWILVVYGENLYKEIAWMAS
jgi:hypothetical protein